MLLNLSNHACAKWSAQQRQAAEQRFGEIRDLPFPDVDPNYDLEKIVVLATLILKECLYQIDHQSVAARHRHPDDAIHVMGKMTFVYQFVKLATAAGVRCIASTTERIAVDHPHGSKTWEFRFVRFREYESMD